MAVRARLALTALLVAAGSLGLLARGTPVADTGLRQLTVADLLFSKSDYRAALSIYRSVADNEQQETTLRTRGRIGVVRSALRVAEFHVAASQVPALRTAAPDDPVALAVVGDACWAAGLFSDAEAAYRDALAIDAALPRARHGLSLVLAARGRLDEALGHVRGAIASGAADPEMRATEGSILERMHRYDEAMTAYEAFLASAPPTWHRRSLDFIRSQIAFLRSFAGQTPVESEFKNGKDYDVIPFRIVNGKVIVRARINGGRPMDFTVDTGAEHTVITAPTARKHDVRSMGETLAAGVGIIGLRGVQRTRLESLQVGSLLVKNLPCLIKNPPIEGLPVGEAEGLSPIALGLSMSIDYVNHHLTIARHLPESRGGLELPLWRHRLASVEGSVNGTPAAFIVDTGGEVISLNRSTARLLFAPADRRRIGLRVYGASGLDPDAYLLPGIDLAFDTVQMSNLPVVVLNLRAPSVLLGYQIGGIVGHKFLSRYRVDFDLERGILRLAPRA